MKTKRPSLILTASASALLASLVPAKAVDFVWTNIGTGDWATAANWNNGTPGGGGGNFVIINNGGTANITSTTNSIQDPFIGSGTGAVGHVNQTAGDHTNVGWSFIGVSGGTGSWDLSGSTNMTTGRIYLGGRRDSAGGGTGSMTVATTGTVTATSDLSVGTRGGSGTLNVSSGNVKANSWMIIGETVNGTGGSTGVVNQTGGTVTNAATDAGGRLWLGSNEGNSAGGASSGTYNLLGGTLNARGVAIGRHYTGIFNQSGGIANIVAGGEVTTIGTVAGSNGSYTLSGGVLNKTGDMQIGAAGTGTMSVSGGTMNSSGWLVVGRSLGGNGTMTVSSGSVNHTDNATSMIVGEEGTGTLTVSGTGAVNVNTTQGLRIGHAATGNGTINLNGGTLAANFIQKSNAGSTAKINLDGGTLKSLANTGDFFLGMGSANLEIKAGGAKFDSNTFSATITQDLNGAGGFTKLGNGTLTLASTASGYAGATTIGAGTLSVAVIADGGAPSTLGGSSSAAANLVFDGGVLRFTGGSGSTNRSFTANLNKSATFDVPTLGNTLTHTGGGVGAGGLTKIGNGTLVLADGANYSYTGVTNANGGVLAASGTYSSGFASGGGGHLTAVNLAEGTLTVPTLTLGAGSNVDFEFGGAATLNAGHDLITIGNASGLALGNTGLYLYNTGGTGAFTTNGTYTLFDYNTAFTGTLAGAFTIANSQVGKLYSITNNLGATTIEISIADTVIAAWNVDGGGSWNAGGNWNPIGVPNSFGAIATFGSVLTGPNSPATVTVDGAKTVGVIAFDNANSYILSGGAGDTITMNNGSGTPLISLTPGSGPQTIAAPLALIAATNIAPAAGTTLTISGNVSGAGSLSITAAGTVVLTGTNGYAGSTNVTTGLLNVGAGATTGSLGNGPVALGAGTLLTINRSNAIAIANNISGTGSLAQTGAGPLTYSGTATYTGTTVLSAGTFISDGSITGTSSLDIENAATLRNSSTTTVAGPLVIANNASVTASLDVQNSATATVTGATTVAGGSASSGSLNVSGSASFTTAGLTVGNNGGTGAVSVSGGSVNGGGTNIGGNSTGSLTMSGGTLSAGTFYIGQNGGGNGTVNMSAGTITANTWSVVGQGGGATGVVNMTGGIWNQSHTDFLTVGENGNGTLTMNGTSVLNDTVAVDTSNRNTNKGNVIVGRNSGGVGVWNLSATATAHIRELRVGDNAGSTGTVNIGGTSLVDSSYDFHIGRAGTGTVNINGGQLNTVSGWTQIGIEAGSSGTLAVTAGSTSAREYQVGVNGTGTVNVSGGTVTATQLFSLGETAAGRGFLTASGTGIANFTNAFDIGRNGFGLANISGTALVTVTNAFNMGHFGASQGYVKQTGGSLTSAGGGDWRIGGTDAAAGAAVGIYSLSGGSFTTHLNFQIGAFGSGQMSISNAGAATITGGFPVVGRFAGGFGVLDVSGGSFTDNSGNLLIVGEDGTGTLNVRGGNVTENSANTNNAVSVGHTATGYGIVNLLGGTLATLSIGTGNAAAISNVNFNGGTLQATGSNATFLQGLTKAYVYSGGGTIDTQSNTVTIVQSLLAPTGNGVTAVAVNSGGAGYQSAPIVKIAAGGGTGATAIATLDGLGAVNGIIITNPGTGYTGAPTVTLIGGAPSSAAVLDPATLAANTSGTLTKIGDGTLNLNGAQGYNTLTTSDGVTNINGVFTTGAATINANAATNIYVSQTLAALNIGAGAEVTFGDGLSFAGGGDKLGAAALVPEPGSLALLAIGALGCLGRRRRSAQNR